MPRPVLLLILATSGILVASPQTSKAPVDVTGTWKYSVPDLRFRKGDETLKCAIREHIVHLRQSGMTFRGYARDGTITCAGETRPNQTVMIDSGVVRGDSIFFLLGPAANRGRIISDSAAGTLVADTPDGVASGSFRLIRIK